MTNICTYTRSNARANREWRNINRIRICFVEEDVLSTVARARAVCVYATAADKLAYDPDFGAGGLEGELGVGVGVQCSADGMIENNCEAFISLRLCVWMDKCARRVSR